MRNIKLVYFKELLDTIRDRRTIISMIVIPVFVFPVLTLGFSTIIFKLEQKSAEEIHKVAVIGTQNAPALYEMIDTSSSVQMIKINEDSLDYAINNNYLQAAIIIPDSFSEKIQQLDSAAVTIMYNATESKSRFASDKLSSAVQTYREQLVQNSLESKGVDPRIVKPFNIDYENVAREKMGSFVLSMFIPYVIIILSLVGAMYTAIDLTAGEKERGTLETILVSPIPRWHLAAGKFLTILTTSIVSTMLVLASMTVSLYFGVFSSAPTSEFMGIEITPPMVLIIFCMMIPTAAMLSALLMSISLFAKTYKEAQSYVSPLMILIIMPALVSFLPGVELDIGLAFVPLVNISLSIKNAMMGNINWLYVVLIFFSTAIYAAFAIFVAHRLFEKENVIFRS